MWELGLFFPHRLSHLKFEIHVVLHLSKRLRFGLRNANRFCDIGLRHLSEKYFVGPIRKQQGATSQTSPHRHTRCRRGPPAGGGSERGPGLCPAGGRGIGSGRGRRRRRRGGGLHWPGDSAGSRSQSSGSAAALAWRSSDGRLQRGDNTTKTTTTIRIHLANFFRRWAALSGETTQQQQ
jgi:hypothetical protein